MSEIITFETAMNGLRSVHRAWIESDGQKCDRAVQDAMVAVRKLWGDARGLSLAKRSSTRGPFAVYHGRLFRERRDGFAFPFIDHAEVWTRKGQRPHVLLTTHTYGYEKHQARAVAAAGYVVIPRTKDESWYYPGEAQLIEIWAPGETP
jgi:hypothetical protein